MSTLTIGGWLYETCDIATFASAADARALTIRGAGLQRLVGLEQCASLVHLRVWKCLDLQSLMPLTGAPGLRTLEVCGGLLSNINGLTTCPLLELVAFSEC